MLMLMFNFLEVSLKYGCTGAHSPKILLFSLHMLGNICNTTVSVKSDCLI